PQRKVGNNQTVPLLPLAWVIVAPLIEGRESGSVFRASAGSASTAFTRTCTKRWRKSNTSEPAQAAMRDWHEINPSSFVRDVVIDLLLKTLPPELRAAAPDLADRVGEHPSVRQHFGKRWGDLTEGQGNV